MHINLCFSPNYVRTRHWGSLPQTPNWGTPLPPPNPLAEGVSVNPKACFASVPSTGTSSCDTMLGEDSKSPRIGGFRGAERTCVYSVALYWKKGWRSNYCRGFDMHLSFIQNDMVRWAIQSNLPDGVIALENLEQLLS